MQGRDTEFLAECPTEMSVTLKSTLNRSIGGAFFGIRQQHLRVGQPLLQQPSGGRHIEKTVELPLEGSQTPAGKASVVTKGQIVHIIRFHHFIKRCTWPVSQAIQVR